MPGIDVVVIVRRPLEGMKLEHVCSEWTSREKVLGKRTAEARADHARRNADEAIPVETRT
jgi:hypothetical protein